MFGTDRGLLGTLCGLRGVEPGGESELEAVAWLFAIEGVDGLQGGHAVQHGPEGDGCLLAGAMAGDAADLLDDEVPELLGSDGGIACGGARNEKGFVEQVLLPGKEKVGGGERADGGFGRLGFAGLAEDEVEACGDLGGNGGLEGFAVGEVAIESVGREVERRGDCTDGDAVEALLREQMHGCVQDGGTVGLRRIRHDVHCTPSVDFARCGI